MPKKTEPAFKTGDRVVLKSGGPVMTVVGPNRVQPHLIDCQWFGGAKLMEGRFPPDSLELYVEPPADK